MNNKRLSYENLDQIKCDSIVDKYIDYSAHKSLTYALALAVGNAADAVEIICVGYIMSVLHQLYLFWMNFFQIYILIKKIQKNEEILPGGSNKKLDRKWFSL